MKLTKPIVATLSIPPGKAEAIFFDDDLRGFGVRLRVGGKRTWIIQYRHGAKQRRHTLGTVTALDHAEARKAARTRLAQVGLGRDPQAEKVEAKAQAATTLIVVVDQYLNHKGTRLRPRSLEAATRYLRQHWLPLHELPIHKIQRRDIATRLGEISEERGVIAADGARTALAALFAWAVREGIAESNPVVATNRPTNPRARDRVLSDSELAEIWRSCRDDTYGRIVKLLAITGQRREEVGAMSWSELDLDRKIWAIPAIRTKNGIKHVVPLAPAAQAIIATIPPRMGRDGVFGEGAGGFSGWSKAKAALDRRIDSERRNARKKAPGAAEEIVEMERWTLHDLRRTAATRMAEIGIQPHIIEAVLNHVSGHKAGVAGTYNRSTYVGDVRAALMLWAEHVNTLVAGAKRKVVPIRGRA